MLSIIVPTKNEPGLQALIGDINGKVAVEHEIIIVDKSDSPPQVRGARLIRQESDGLGSAFLEGLKGAKGDVIVLMDGDGSHDPADIDGMLKQMADCDIVIGSRYVEGGKNEDAFPRRAVSRMMNAAAMLVLGLGVKDLMSGFAMFRKSVFDGLELRPSGYKIVMETAYKARRKGAAIREAPITFHRRTAGRSKAGFNLSGLKEIIRIKMLILSLRLNLR